MAAASPQVVLAEKDKEEMDTIIRDEVLAEHNGVEVSARVSTQRFEQFGRWPRLQHSTASVRTRHAI